GPTPAQNSINAAMGQIQQHQNNIQHLQGQMQVIGNAKPGNLVEVAGFAEAQAARIEAIEAAIAAQQEQIQIWWTFIDLLL
ncbi:MAG: hypothetical protein MN733_04260, partial [Nitrososphaera sp.]|nr:hypothetical protein [Nitrososphaera sp.]